MNVIQRLCKKRAMCVYFFFLKMNIQKVDALIYVTSNARDTRGHRYIDMHAQK